MQNVLTMRGFDDLKQDVPGRNRRPELENILSVSAVEKVSGYEAFIELLTLNIGTWACSSLSKSPIIT